MSTPTVTIPVDMLERTVREALQSATWDSSTTVKRRHRTTREKWSEFSEEQVETLWPQIAAPTLRLGMLTSA